MPSRNPYLNIIFLVIFKHVLYLVFLHYVILDLNEEFFHGKDVFSDVE